MVIGYYEVKKYLKNLRLLLHFECGEDEHLQMISRCKNWK